MAVVGSFWCAPSAAICFDDGVLSFFFIYLSTKEEENKDRKDDERCVVPFVFMLFKSEIARREALHLLRSRNLAGSRRDVQRLIVMLGCSRPMLGSLARVGAVKEEKKL